MDTKEGGFQEPRYLEFPKYDQKIGEDGKPLLNRYSTHLTRDHEFPGAQVWIGVLPYTKLAL